MSSIALLSELFGVDLTTVNHKGPEFPPEVPGRVLNIDGDFLAYQVSADDTKAVDEMMHNHDVAVETLRLLAGASTVKLHLTKSGSTKGNRFDIAIQKEYQVGRKDKVKPKHLGYIKNWMEVNRGAISHADQEADDGLAQANVAAIEAGTPELSVLVSKDKDLQMVPGFHLDWDNGGLVVVEGFGSVSLDRSKSSPKIVGKGTSFFWAQMLTGDAADSITGLPSIPGNIMNIVSPNKDTPDLLERLKSGTAKQAAAARKKLDARKEGKVGAVTAFALMERIKSDKAAFYAIRELYKSHGERHGFHHWKTGEQVEWHKVFLSEAKLLWMRHYNDENDVVRFLKGLQ